MQYKDFFEKNKKNDLIENDINPIIFHLYNGLYDSQFDNYHEQYKEEYDSLKNSTLDYDTSYDKIIENFLQYKIPELAEIFQESFLTEIKTIDDLKDKKNNNNFIALKRQIIQDYIEKDNECREKKISSIAIPIYERIPFIKESILSSLENVIRFLNYYDLPYDENNEWSLPKTKENQEKTKNTIIRLIGNLQSNIDQYDMANGREHKNNLIENFDLPGMKP